jgi:hypothetical protein
MVSGHLQGINQTSAPQILAMREPTVFQLPLQLLKTPATTTVQFTASKKSVTTEAKNKAIQIQNHQ